ncbi:SIR2 family NAD-dependent protein deacylase [Variovorax sp. LT1P1]|uniref:SIR2 family NAD-dependent protein deacylase n=1 Tax=Variovorax sp. LT1P1 TaxID=3443730 RepID=UPI003F4766E6
MTYFDQSSVPPLLAGQLRSAQRIVVLTGAGVSAESGIPTFRHAQQGLWARFDAARLATTAGFRDDPALVWAWYESRRRAALLAQPNAGHLALAQMARWPWLEDFAVITQNVDDLHERAGSGQVVHLHGSLFEPRCSACSRPWHTTSGGGADPGRSDSATAAADGHLPPPRCQHCGGLIRPGVVWFGEGLPEREWLQAMHMVVRADLMLVVGTSATVHPAASLPSAARQQGCKIWVINPDPDASAGMEDCHWIANAAAGLPALSRIGG